tara:strand:+ start:176 stop:1312 length:1137 start_codon:yes stop_codon:yes gene_type:complete
MKTIKTLDDKHSEISEKYLHDKNVLIPKYENQINKLKSLISDNKTKKKNKNPELIKKEIEEIQKKIITINKKYNDYYLNNAKYIFTYFEDKQKINDLNNKNTNTSENNKISKFFNLNNRNIISDDNIINNKDKSSINNDSKNIDKYFNNITKSLNNYDEFNYDYEVCKKCNNGEIIFVETEGICICNNCSNITKFLIENDKPSYKEPPKEICFYAYKRINHLREILAQFQAKETTNIPAEVFENIKNKIKKERIELKDLTNSKTKEILKNLGYNKYYEHIPFIKDKLGIKPPLMSTELEDTLCNLFNEIQRPYSKYCPSDRVNFLNYYYTLYKLCELLNERKFLPYFPMLKDRDKRIEQDQIWKKICQELNWKFIPTQ